MPALLVIRYWLVVIGLIGKRQHSLAEFTERLDRFTPVSLPEDKIKEIMRIMQSYAGSKGVDVLPQVDGWVG